LAYNELDNTVYALNWQGSGWPFGGDNAVYAIQPNGRADRVISGTYSGIAMSHGGPFGQALYLSDSNAGQVLRLERGATEVVVSGLPAPGPLAFDPLTGTLAVVCDGGRQVAWVGADLPLAVTAAPGTPGGAAIPAEQSAAGRATATVRGQQVRLAVDAAQPEVCYAVTEGGLSGDFTVTARLDMVPATLQWGQNRIASVYVTSDVAGQQDNQLAYVGFMQKTVGFAATGGACQTVTDMRINGAWGRFCAAPWSGPPTGLFRLERRHGIIRTYAFVDGSWVQLSRQDGEGFSDRVRLRFQIDTSWDAYQGAAHQADFVLLEPAATGATAQPTPGWASSLWVTGADGGSVCLQFGVRGDATDNLDPLLGEDELPPQPPADAFDARWQRADGTGTARDWRSPAALEQGAVWTLSLQGDGLAVPVYVTWAPQALPWAGSFRLVGRDASGQSVDINLERTDAWELAAAGGTQLQLVYTPAAVTYDYNLPPGWHLVSLPGAVPDPRLETLFPVALSLFGYGAAYEPAPYFAPGTGYWLNVPGPVHAAGTARAWADTALVRFLPARWSLVGPGAVALDADALQAANPTLISVYGYADGYYRPTRLEPGSAYWANLRAPAAMDLSGRKAAAGTARRLATAGKPPEAILWAVASGRTQTLELGVSPGPADALPPRPPAALFDARVEIAPGVSSWRVPATDRALPVRLQGDITELRWQAPADSPWELQLDDQRVRLAGTGRTPVTGASVVHVRQVAGRPARTALNPAYPNPFNPSTAIPYELGQAGSAQLQVYGITGQRVRDLSPPAQPAGHYQVVWDGRDDAGQPVADGVYVVVLQFGACRQTQRVALIR
jgi:hypothetical protein